MKDDYFLDREGNSLTGKIPLQARFSGTGDRAAVRGPANAALNAFLAGVRQSLADSHRKTLALPNGGEMTMRHSFGTTTVEVRVGPAIDVTDDLFYGGILLRPRYIPNEAPFFTAPGSLATWTAAHASQVVYSEVTSNGNLTRTGRPALPGTPEDAVTDWLVVQIAGDKPLGSNPVKNGTVKIFRVEALKAGDLPETRSTAKKYLLSLDTVTGFFYLGNKLATKISAAPVVSGPPEAFSGVGLLLLRTYRMRYGGFAGTADAEAFVFLIATAAGQATLYALDTLNRPVGGYATWRQLAVAPFSSEQQNTFGREYSEAVDQNGAATITCSGSNGAGVCSGFEVQIRPNPNARPTLSGSLSTMGSGNISGTAEVINLTRTVGISRTVEAISSYRRIANTDPLVDTQFDTMKFRYQRPSFVSSTSGTYVGARSAQIRDTFLGGYFPTHAPSKAAFSFSSDVGETGAGGWVDVYEFPRFSYQRWARETVEKTNWKTEYAWENQYNAQTLSYSATFELSSIGFLDRRDAYDYLYNNRTPTPTKTAAPMTFDGGFELVPDPTVRFRYWSRDRPTDTLALQVEVVQPARCLSVPLNTGPPANSNAFAPVPGYAMSYSGGTFMHQYDEAKATLRLIDRTGKVMYLVQDVFGIFATPRPTWTKPVTANAIMTHGAGWLPTDRAYQAQYPGLREGTFSESYDGTYPAPYLPSYPSTTNASGGPAYYSTETITEIPDINIAYSYAGGPFSKSGTVAAIGAEFPGSRYGHDLAGDSTPTVVFVDQRFPAPPPASAGTTPPQGSLDPVESAIYMDPRTGGYIAHVTMRTTVTGGRFVNQVVTYAGAVVAVIGNKFGVMPLQSVIDEWRALGDTDPAGDGKKAFVHYEGVTRLI